MIGQTLGHYKILAKLGAGGMGEVYRAEDTTLKRQVALKVLPADLAASHERLQRFQREAEILAALDHPNIVHIYTVEESEGVRFLTMQLVQGQPLAELIPMGGMALERIFEISIQLADALAAAHEKGVIHRDLKPENVIVDEEGRVKILDFGLAKLRQEAEINLATGLPTEPLTEEGRIVGTMPYMSPEQLEGKKVDHRSDIFSLGVVLYEMATGERPFKGDSSASLITAIMSHSPREVDSLRAELPHHLSRIIRHCLEKAPSRRYQSALDVRNELEDLQREESSVAPAAAVPEPEPEPTQKPVRWPLVAVAGVGAAIVLIALVSLWLGRSQPAAEPSVEALAEPAAAADETQPPMIVVLPFENLGDPEDEYFADGMTEEITSRLAMVSGLRVISRTSAMQYKTERPPMKQIGEELGVDFVLEGTVRWEKPVEGPSRVRVTPQLIRVSDDSHLWSERYERQLASVFQVQSEIAQQVIGQLDVALLESEGRAIDAKPTDNLEAFQAYLRGKYYAGRSPPWGPENLKLKVQSFQEAVELDPGFALAYAELSRAHSAFVHFGADPSGEHRSFAKVAAERALELAPESPESHLALGYYHYWALRDYEPALTELAIAVRDMPNNSEIFLAIGAIRRRLGNWEDALANQEKAFKLNPRDAQIATEISATYLIIRRYREAVSYLDQSIALLPDQTPAYWLKAWTHWISKGTTVEARAALEAMPQTQEVPAAWFWFRQEIYEGKYESALDRLSSTSQDWIYAGVGLEGPKSLFEAYAYQLLKEPELARSAYDSARAVLEDEVATRPHEPRVHSALGIAYAGLGHKEEAIREGKRAVELRPVSEDAFWGPATVWFLAIIYTMVGEHEAAVDQLDYLLSIPSTVSVPLLRLDPFWNPIRDHPRFQALLEKYGEEAGA